MQQKSQGAQDKVNCVKARLAEHSKQDFRILLVRCLAPLLDYWMRSVPPCRGVPSWPGSSKSVGTLIGGR
jgi:hypothetical protein